MNAHQPEAYVYVQEHAEYAQQYQQSPQTGYTSNYTDQENSTTASFGYMQSMLPTQFTQQSAYTYPDNQSGSSVSYPETSVPNSGGFPTNTREYSSYSHQPGGQQPSGGPGPPGQGSRQRVSLQVTPDQLDVLKSLGII